MVSLDSSFWKETVDSEIDSILSNHTWELVDLPPGNKPLDFKWIFKRKMKADGTIDKYKARLVVKDFKQKEDLDYFDTYSPITRITSIRMLIALTAVYGLEIHQMDVKILFLNGELEEEIYMKQPEGFVVSERENKATPKPVAVGFGISKPEHVKQVAEWGADGVIVGSAMVRILGEAKSPEEGLKELEVFATSLKSAHP
ncbi:hypothetical protein T459_22324 [Capsicum annuum]|uniref:tryptophan synthase n=1 Tax=Capsicum annuum TaxID=4072 RepID=A0A2G2YZ51_CAPAN|nr:hypothetical protein T459_22324 [Capsicum annuum]